MLVEFALVITILVIAILAKELIQLEEKVQQLEKHYVILEGQFDESMRITAAVCAEYNEEVRNWERASCS